jgi:MFS family permease
MQSTAPRSGSLGALAILLTGQAMATMDGSILAVAAPSLRANLHASGAELQLVVAMYMLAFAALVVTGARLGDVLGPRRAFGAGLSGFTLASLLGGFAPTPAMLIVARALQGAAAALMTAQVLSIIQAEFAGERRARAIGAYSMILAVGVAAGQIIGGLLVSAGLMSAAWRPALLVNAPIGAALLAGSTRALGEDAPVAGGRLDLGGVVLLATALLSLIVPLSFGRDYGWPPWIWPCFGACTLAGWGFVARERGLKARGARPLFDLGLLRGRRVAYGVVAVLLGMGSYAGLLLSLTLYLQGSLGFSPLHAGLIFAVYASGFAIASLTWTRAGPRLRGRLPILGPMLMGACLLALGLIASRGGWPLVLAMPLLFAAGVGHALGFSPLANRLTTLVRPEQASDLSGLILTADFVGMALGATSFVGLYLGLAPDDPGRALAVTTVAIAIALAAAAACARRVAARGRTSRVLALRTRLMS